MLFSILKQSIIKKSYLSKSDIKEKIYILFTNNQLTLEQLEILLDLLEEDI